MRLELDLTGSIDWRNPVQSYMSSPDGSLVANGSVTRLWYRFFRKGKAPGRGSGRDPAHERRIRHRKPCCADGSHSLFRDKEQVMSENSTLAHRGDQGLRHQSGPTCADQPVRSLPRNPRKAISGNLAPSSENMLHQPQVRVRGEVHSSLTPCRSVFTRPRPTADIARLA
jgi:hypothetical protein